MFTIIIKCGHAPVVHFISPLKFLIFFSRNFYRTEIKRDEVFNPEENQEGVLSNVFRLRKRGGDMGGAIFRLRRTDPSVLQRYPKPLPRSDPMGMGSTFRLRKR